MRLRDCHRRFLPDHQPTRRRGARGRSGPREGRPRPDVSRLQPGLSRLPPALAGGWQSHPVFSQPALAGLLDGGVSPRSAPKTRSRSPAKAGARKSNRAVCQSFVEQPGCNPGNAKQPVSVTLKGRYSLTPRVGIAAVPGGTTRRKPLTRRRHAARPRGALRSTVAFRAGRSARGCFSFPAALPAVCPRWPLWAALEAL